MKTTTLIADSKRWSWVVVAMLSAFVMTVAPLVVIFGGSIDAPAVWVKTAVAGWGQGSDDLSFWYPRTAHDKLHGGLLVEGFDQESCHSRYQSAMYRRNPGRKPSEYLVSKLRRHEVLQRRCGPGTAAYSNALEQLKSGKNAASPECTYLVSISYRGLGNRILAAASAFLYALLTDRVLLVDPSNEMDGLFCEPFLNTTWLLPRGFPLWDYPGFYLDTAERYGKMRENGVLRTDVMTGSSAAPEMPAFAYIHLDYNQTEYDQLFFCDEDQQMLLNFQWLLMRTDSYIVPGLFFLKAFQEELDMLFPERDTVFHHLGGYLFHPTNHVWGLITRYYRAHLAWAQRRVGIQVRVFPWQAESPELLERITTCTQEEGLLPGVLDTEQPAVSTAKTAPSVKSSAVVITSLKAWYYEQMKSMYWENATANGEVVVVNQPSHEEFQHYGVKSHEYKAWAEIYLLSLTDMLVTTGKSTFGYVAQGLAGLRPWVLLNQQANGTAGHNQPCSRDMSMEPCFHIAPLYDCKRLKGSGTIVPHVRHCEDVPQGLKLVE
ncbi:galactoside 2-alpha-L-fucosyltransferase-like [Phragmites australis]|uniref:galactoside 2-alpha-L-fucosyltransferase-like n=1 Tax=Phragmites australis TaxID=29695 RepID=UPI002D7735E2|nr:galactoside 2-alpha-L-fucosyltransferase-like [Phragmites australis]